MMHLLLSYIGSGPAVHGPRTRRLLRLPLAMWFAALLLFSFRVRSQHDGVRSGWFDSLPAAPDGLSLGADRDEIATAVFRCLTQGKAPADALEFLALDTSPRVLFVSWRTEGEPARVRVGSGQGLRAAIVDGVSRVLAVEKPGRHLRGVRLDLVRSVLVSPAFVLRESQLPAPSLIGIAFSAAGGFAFLPDQLVTGYLITPDGRLAFHRIGDAVSHEKDWSALGRWNEIVRVDGAQTAYFFETESLFTDGTAVIPLFRGHRLFTETRADDLVSAARRAGEFLTRICGESGDFVFRAPAWDPGEEGKLALWDNAAAVLALLELHRETGDAEVLQAVDRALRFLAAAIKGYPRVRNATCVVDDFRSRLDTNALTLLCLLAYPESGAEAQLRRRVSGLARYLLDQQQSDGSFVCERYHPSGNVRASSDPLRASGLAVVALTQLYERTGARNFLTAATNGLAALVKSRVADRDAEEQPQDEYLTQALNGLFTHSRDKTYESHVERIALGIVATQTLDPVCPDLLGNSGSSPSTTVVAGRTLSLLAAEALLRDLGRTAAADRILSCVHLNLVFQLQGQLDAASAMYLHHCEDLYGAFREEISDFRVTLAGQSRHVLALLEACRVVRSRPDGRLPLDDQSRAALDAARARFGRFPRIPFLEPESPIPPSVPGRVHTAPEPRPVPKMRTHGQPARHR